MLFAKFLLSIANSLNPQRRTHKPCVVQGLSDLLWLSRSFAFGIKVTLNVAMHLKFARAVLQHHRLISDGHIPGSSDVSLRAGPPYADHLIARITRGRGVLECGAVHHAPAPKQHVIRFILANAPPLRLLFETGMRHRD